MKNNLLNTMKFPYNIWNYKKNITSEIILQGDSISARYSGFWIGSWSVMLDAGLKSPFNPKHIFVTHPHSDHIGELMALITGVEPAPTIYVPHAVKDTLEAYIRSSRNLIYMCKNASNPCKIVACKPGDVIEFKSNKKKLMVKIFQTDHTIDSVGFAFSELVKKRDPAFLNCNQEELKLLSRSGVKLTIEEYHERFIYTGDTRNSIFLDPNLGIDWSKYPVIITECTFVGNLLSNEINQEISLFDNSRGHNHLDNLVKVAEKYPKTKFLLCHWSDRHKKEDLAEYFERQKFSNIEPWINPV